MKKYENPSSCFVVLLVIIHEQVIYQLEMYFRNLPRGWYVPMYECVTHTHVCITVSHDSTNKNQCILNRLRVRTSRLLHDIMSRMKQMLSF